MTSPHSSVSAVAASPPSHASPSTNRAPVGGKSWADDIQIYQVARATLPWKPDQQQAVKHVTRYEKSREEREYDLVLGKFRNAEKELDRQQQEGATYQRNLEHGRAKQLRNVQRFNLINHTPLYEGARNPGDPPPGAERREPRKTSNVEYNIVTNLSQTPSKGGGRTTATAAAAVTPSKHPTREFNILTNQYHQRHDERTRAELEQAKPLAAAKFFRTHDFDPVRISFFDDDKELVFQARRREAQRLHGKDKVLALPPRERYSEGRLYNIVNQEVINPAEIQRVTTVPAGHGDKHASAQEARMRVNGDLVRARTDAKCLNRFAHERHEQAYIHGYDPITNESFDGGLGAKPRVPLRTHAPLPVWDALQKSAAAPCQSPTGAPSQPFSSPSPTTPRVKTNTCTLSTGKGASVGSTNVLVVDHDAVGSSLVPTAAGRFVDQQKHTQPETQASALTGVRTGGFSMR